MSNAPGVELVKSCPSAQPSWEGSVAIGVVEGTANEPRLAYFAKPQSVTDQLLALSGPVNPTEIFRFVAPCAEDRCVHFHDRHCELVTQIVQLLPTVVEIIPACKIRPNCRWWFQEGKSACARCPQIVTDNHNPSDEMRVAATPHSESTL
jgi:hypothetical protein